MNGEVGMENEWRRKDGIGGRAWALVCLLSETWERVETFFGARTDWDDAR